MISRALSLAIEGLFFLRYSYFVCLLAGIKITQAMLKNKLKIFLQTERIKSMLIVVAEAGPCNNNIEVCRMTLPKIVFNFNMRVVIMKDEMSFMFYNISVQVRAVVFKSY